MLVFLDTNIILDYIDSKRRILYPESSDVFALAEKGNITLCASALTFSNIAYILRKLDYSDLMRIFKDLRTVLDILPTTKMILDAAIQSRFTDFEDAIQFYTAYQGGADVVVTRNVKDYADTSIRILTPKDFLQTNL